MWKCVRKGVYSVFVHIKCICKYLCVFIFELQYITNIKQIKNTKYYKYKISVVSLISYNR